MGLSCSASGTVQEDRWHDPCFLSMREKKSFLYSFQYSACVAVCSVHVHGMCVPPPPSLFFLMHTVLLIFMYFSRCEEKLYFSELQRFVCLKQEKKRRRSKWDVFMKMLNEDISGHLPLKTDAVHAVMVTWFVLNVHVFFAGSNVFGIWRWRNPDEKLWLSDDSI